ncbi:hypothetical protein Cgig2_028005 [Carnegiea gigantea]|uniref:Endonuclease/exonuclease/phosphatase domain-containing protein n=1 Tax=Carnegiea gigantea TaxID=171969 RepID=A0A9Q1GZN8_9CARY|nr:hypothetical protein Cgig2_028005 [Carnegiea gigantea]
MFGHTVEVCKKKNNIKTEWMRVQQKQLLSPKDNHEYQKEQLWLDLKDISQSMEEAWRLMGILTPLYLRMTESVATKELTSLLESCALHEPKSTGAYFSWTNKTIWSRIDHLFLNDYWYEVFDYTHSCYMTNSLSDHTPLVLQFHLPLNQRPLFNTVTCGINIMNLKASSIPLRISYAHLQCKHCVNT